MRGKGMTPGGFYNMSINAYYYDHQDYILFMVGILPSFKIISKVYKKGWRWPAWLFIDMLVNAYVYDP